VGEWQTYFIVTRLLCLLFAYLRTRTQWAVFLEKLREDSWKCVFAFKKPFTSRGFDTWSRYVFTLYYVRGRARARERERERERENDGFFLGGGEVCVCVCLCWFV